MDRETNNQVRKLVFNLIDKNLHRTFLELHDSLKYLPHYTIPQHQKFVENAVYAAFISVKFYLKPIVDNLFEPWLPLPEPDVLQRNILQYFHHNVRAPIVLLTRTGMGESRLSEIIRHKLMVFEHDTRLMCSRLFMHGLYDEDFQFADFLSAFQE